MWKVYPNTVVAFCLFIMAPIGPALAVTHYVNLGMKIQAAIDASSNGDEIEVAPGMYHEAINFNGKAVRLYSSGGRLSTTIDGYGYLHVVQCVSGEGAGTILEGFTITGGNAQGSGGPDFNGGGMLNSGSSPTVRNCIFFDNTADYGGGMYNRNRSNPTVTNCTFEYNTARVWGGGMFNKLSNPTVTNCLFSDNTANWDGGGMFNELSSPTLTYCHFINNIAQNSGGGMYSMTDSNPIVTSCTFSGNNALGNNIGNGGGGMYNLNDSNPTVTNCMFLNNTALYMGGGIHDSNSIPAVTNCMFIGNTASGGGGMYNHSASMPMVTNCILWNNLAAYGGGMFNSLCHTMVSNCTFTGNAAELGGGIYNLPDSHPMVINCILWGNNPDQIHNPCPVLYSDVQGGWAGEGNIDTDPLFVDAGFDLHLSSSKSPCVDTGADIGPYLPSFDLDGHPRIVDGDRNGTATLDMGAYEFQYWLIHNITQDVWYKTIQAAINYSDGGDHIEVAPGTYYEAIDFKGKSVRLYSSGGPDVTTINGNGYYHVVKCVSGEDANTILEGFTITGGNANGVWPDNCGGGMYNERSSPTVKNCVFTGNIAYLHGGGMYNERSSPTIIDCLFTGNAAYEGGGMYNHVYNDQVYGHPRLIRCTFSKNTAVVGAGLCNDWHVHSEIVDCQFTENTASEHGGGMYNVHSSSPSLAGCVFAGNKVENNGYGGGMLNSAGSNPSLANCMFMDNSAGSGGGMYNFDNSHPVVTNCTFRRNFSTVTGGGMYNYSNSNPIVTNCILWDNIGGELFDGVTSITTITYSNVQGGWAGEGNIDTDPCFVDTNNPDPNLWNLRLQQNSPCIDVGNNSTLNLPDFDLDGHPRIIDGDCNDTAMVDMGAYEFNYAYMGDLDYNCRVDFFDYSILSRAWETKAGDPNWDWACDMSDPPDDDIDWRDVAILCGNWLAGT